MTELNAIIGVRGVPNLPLTVCISLYSYHYSCKQRQSCLATVVLGKGGACKQERKERKKKPQALKQEIFSLARCLPRLLGAVDQNAWFRFPCADVKKGLCRRCMLLVIWGSRTFQEFSDLLLAVQIRIPRPPSVCPPPRSSLFMGQSGVQRETASKEEIGFCSQGRGAGVFPLMLPPGCRHLEVDCS